MINENTIRELPCYNINIRDYMIIKDQRIIDQSNDSYINKKGLFFGVRSWKPEYEKIINKKENKKLLKQKFWHKTSIFAIPSTSLLSSLTILSPNNLLVSLAITSGIILTTYSIKSYNKNREYYKHLNDYIPCKKVTRSRVQYKNDDYLFKSYYLTETEEEFEKLIQSIYQNSNNIPCYSELVKYMKKIEKDYIMYCDYEKQNNLGHTKSNNFLRTVNKAVFDLCKNYLVEPPRIKPITTTYTPYYKTLLPKTNKKPLKNSIENPKQLSKKSLFEITPINTPEQNQKTITQIQNTIKQYSTIEQNNELEQLNTRLNTILLEHNNLLKTLHNNTSIQDAHNTLAEMLEYINNETNKITTSIMNRQLSEFKNQWLILDNENSILNLSQNNHKTT